MDNQMTTFNFNQNEVRTIVDEKGEVWFVAKDVCEVLEISKYRDAISNLDEDERGSVKVDTLGGAQEMATINESGLYTIVMRSNKPLTNTKPFRHT
ncbi:prophage antirepressor [Candidatus Magnetoovum chiemensis]|nr:prophage antirepressor [Candidatus Magnetoovum chiemensis]